MKNTYQILEELLITQEKYKSLENNNILKTKIYEDAYNLDADLLELLLSNNEVNKIFFREVNKIKVFDSQKFISFINSKNFLPDSYTKYCNKIGLTHNNNFISKNNDVVLDFPYKDCVLAGGQTKDDQKREEITFNEIIARDEIGRMLAPKVFTNAKRYTKDGVEENIEFNEDDNLIIKGNNLIALSSILERFEGKVKCIYIDPPYNTGNDSFNYNDRFNHSTWLTFMKNRLEVARKFLKDDGAIFIQCDDNEQAYLKVLCDEIFGRENFVSALFLLNNLKGNYNTNYFAEVGEYILVYAKNKQSFIVYDLLVDDDEELENWEQDSLGFWKIGRELKATGENAPREKRPTMFFPLYISDDNDFSLEKSDKYHLEIYPIRNGQEVCWNWSKQQFIKQKEEVLIFRDKHNNITIKKKQRPTLGNLISKKPKNIFYHPSYSNTVSAKQIEELFQKKVFLYSKPEALIKDIIEISCKENDLIMDFHLGSGTTCAVAHKMKRRYIGIEQMDYINTVTVPRLEKVINGDRGGYPSY